MARRISQRWRRQFASSEATLSTPSRFWTLLNSGFTLFFLSSIILGGLTFVVKEYRKRQADESIRQQTIESLDNEISHRLDLLAQGISHAGCNLKELRSAIAQGSFPQDASIPTYQSDEFKATGLERLIQQESDLIDKNEGWRFFGAAIDGADRLATFEPQRIHDVEYLMELKAPFAISQRDQLLKSIAGDLQMLNLTRWSGAAGLNVAVNSLTDPILPCP